MDTKEYTSELAQELDQLKTVSAKIRLLDSNGWDRADIARALGKRYQHVRNVLEEDRRKVQAAAVASELGVDADAAVFRLKISAQGQVDLPKALLAELDFSAGRMVLASVAGGELKLLPVSVALKKAQDLVQGLVGTKVSMSEELIAERRAEARQDNR